MKLTNGNKTIERSAVDYEANKATWTLRGWTPVSDKPKMSLLKPKKDNKKKDD